MKLGAFLLVLCVAYATADFHVPSLEVFDDGFQDGFDDLFGEEMPEVEVSEDKLMAYGQRRCTPVLCCPMELLCGPGYTCWNDHRSVQSMVNCWQPRLDLF